MSPLVLGGRYEVLEPLGRGGMAYVCKARDNRLLREVAVKILDPSRVEEDRQQSILYFHREARAVASLSSRNVIQLFDYSGPDEEVAYLVMELVDGGDVDKMVLAHHPIPESLLLSVALGAARGVRDAHAQGLIHRDIKPGNVLIERSGRVLLSDFGVAKAWRNPSQLGRTVAGQKTLVFGTVDFMAPEQVLERDVGPFTDVFALGALIYCLGAYRSPFDAKRAIDIMRQVVAVDYTPLRSQRADLSIGLETIVDKCLQAEASWRPTSAEVVVALERLAKEQGVDDLEAHVRAFLQRAESPTADIPAPIRESASAEPVPDNFDMRELTRPGRRLVRVGSDDVTPQVDPLDRLPRRVGSDEVTPKVRVDDAPERSPSDEVTPSADTRIDAFGAREDTAVGPAPMSLTTDSRPELDVARPGTRADRPDSRSGDEPGRGRPTRQDRPGPGADGSEAATNSAEEWAVVERLPDTVTKPPAPPDSELTQTDARVHAPWTEQPAYRALAIGGAVVALAAVIAFAIALSGNGNDAPQSTTIIPLEPDTPVAAGRPVVPSTSPAEPKAVPVDLGAHADDSIVTAPEPLSTDSLTGLDDTDDTDDTDEAATSEARPHKRRRTPSSKPATRLPPKPAVKKVAEIEVLVRPWGQVYLDGVDKGATPLGKALEVPPGRHEIVVHHPRFGKRRRVVTLKAGDTTRLQIDMRQE